MTTVAPISGHAVVVAPNIGGECSFYSGDWRRDLRTFGWVLMSAAGQCGEPTTATATGTHGLIAGLCANHTAHVRRCPACSQTTRAIVEVAPMSP